MCDSPTRYGGVRGVMTGSGEPEEVGLLMSKGKAYTGDPNGSCWSEQSIPIAIIFFSVPT